MTIIASELKFYKSEVVDDTAANGGVMSTNAISTGIVNNVWPNVLSAERLAGSSKFRKLFCKIENDDDDTLAASRFWLDIETPADDWQVLFEGSQTDIQSGIAIDARKYGCGTLETDVAMSGATLVVNLEDNSLKSGDDAIFEVGGLIRITDKYLITSSGNEEFLIIDTVTPHATLAQVTITTVELLQSAYTVAGNTRVMSVLEGGDLQCVVDNWAETSGSGSYDDSAHPLLMDNIGTVEQEWTLTFGDATSFTVVGNTVGSVGSGTVSGDFSPSNDDFTKPYFNLEASGWGGTWGAGDTIVFKTHPAAMPLWEKRVVPAGASSLSGDKITLVYTGEAAS